VDVWLPERFTGELYVETATADGRFRGEGAYAGSSPGRTWVSLALIPASRPGGRVSSALPGDLATLALRVRGPNRTMFVARWADAPASVPAKIRLYVNSRRADMFVRAGKSVVRCEELRIPQPVRFDQYCDIARGDVPDDGRLVLIRRDQSDEQTQIITVNVRDLR
jgi:hypothetical protein